MQIAKVIGNIWATRKESTLTGMKLLIVQPINILDNDMPCSVPIVAADMIGAGMGETVIIVTGSQRQPQESECAFHLLELESARNAEVG